MKLCQIEEAEECDWCIQCGWNSEDGDCDYDPREIGRKPIGMFHCPACSAMVLAGMSHPKRLSECDGREKVLT